MRGAPCGTGGPGPKTGKQAASGEWWAVSSGAGEGGARRWERAGEVGGGRREEGGREGGGGGGRRGRTPGWELTPTSPRSLAQPHPRRPFVHSQERHTTSPGATCPKVPGNTHENTETWASLCRSFVPEDGIVCNLPPHPTPFSGNMNVSGFLNL